MNPSHLKPGTKLRVAFNATLVKTHDLTDGSKLLELSYLHDGEVMKDALPLDVLEILSAVPAEFPVLPDDVWRDHDGDLWLAQYVDNDGMADKPYVQMVCSRASKQPRYGQPDEAIATQYGPFTLISRRAQPDGEGQ